MSTLVDWQIREWAQLGHMTPFDPAQVNPASVNLRIGTTAKIETESGIYPLELGCYSQGTPYLVPPGGWILTDVMEAISIPPYMEGTVVLRSSAARRGWDHAMAGFIDPGYGYGKGKASKLTLEFVNCLRHHSLPIYPGQALVQLRLNRLQVEPMEHYGTTGRYNGAACVEGCKDPSL
jgi:deoxycytidine triphosphate deaminase